MAFTKQVFPKFLNPPSDIVELIGQNYFDLYLFKSEYFTPLNAQISRQNLHTIQVIY